MSKQTITAERLFDKQYDLGESPLFNHQADTLSWVDITRSTLYTYRKDEEVKSYSLGQFIGAAVPTVKNRYILAMTTGIYLFDLKTGLRRLVTPETLSPNQRFNDGKCDPRGRFLAGTMALLDCDTASRSLFSYEQNKPVRTIQSPVGLSNGLAWSKDQRTFYYIDTLSKTISVFDYDPDAGLPVQLKKKILVSEGSPDGMTIDSEGMLWVAIWGGSCVKRINPVTEQVISQIKLPAKNVTSCCFAGQKLDELIITTAKDQDRDSVFSQNRSDGCLFIAKPGVSGFPDTLFDDTQL